MNSHHNHGKRYIYDSLYGKIYLPDWIWDVIICPELQRLREVRLCNINSFCLTGGANINRYEHAIGTCYLAQECLRAHSLLDFVTEKEQKLFLLAALLHDVISAPFGHSIEYIESKEGFDHERAFEYVVFGEKAEKYQYHHATLEPMFWGRPGTLLSTLQNKIKLSDQDIKTIGKFIAGEGRFGPLLNNSIDLDNIDNVFRLAYHVGLFQINKTPQKLAESLWVKSNRLTIVEESIPLVKKWHEIRKRLYSYLLLNPEEFSAKCMLTDAIELGKMEKKIPFNWRYTDYELLYKLSHTSSDVSEIITRLMMGDLYGCVGIFSSRKTDKYGILSDTKNRRKLEKEMTELIRPEASSYIEDFSSDAQNVIKGIRGIVYDSENKILKISIDFREEIMEQLIQNELSSYSNTVKNLFNDAKLKYSQFGMKSSIIAIHLILDVNKTMRQVCIQVGGEMIQIGESSNRLLIGIFFKNQSLNMYNIGKMPRKINNMLRHEILTHLSKTLNDSNIEEVKLYGEDKDI
jgi:HD superfamily phosphohydrolase